MRRFLTLFCLFSLNFPVLSGGTDAIDGTFMEVDCVRVCQ